MNMIETHDLVKRYNKHNAVDKVSLAIEEGEIFGLLGPNGAGKTTTMMMLTTLREPTSGSAEVNGFDIVKEPAKVRKSIGIVFQDPSSDEILTGYENLKLHGMLYDMPGDLREKRIKEVLALVDLSGRKNDLVKKYSGGMRRRLELARGLMHHPKILFLDEPTLGLDPQTREHIWVYIERLAKEEKITIVITTHYMEEADKLCDRVAIIDSGKIVALGRPKNLKEQLGGDIIRLKTRKLNVEALKKLKYVKEINKGDGEYVLTIVGANEHLQEILAIAGKVDSVELSSPTLGDVFLHFTGKNIREDTPEGGWGEKAIQASARK
ncbi:MAG TPA: ATP-binding cassette domain-containing protein [archaeon]|nr:ATP-binding cassette domain-containing protein [archaeon]